MPQSFLWNAFESGASSPITSIATTVTLDSVLGLRAPGYIVIDPDSDTKREYIFFAALGASSLDNVTRGLAGSAAGAQAHDSGVRVRHVTMHQLFDDIWDQVNLNETALINHGVDSDPHPVYLSKTEADALYVELTGDAMTGILNMQGNAITTLPAPGAGGDAANRTYVDGSLTTHEGDIANHPEFLDLAGVRTMTGALKMGTNQIKGVTDPTLDDDAATKGYADSLIPGVGVGLFLELDGSSAMTGNIDAGGNRVIDVANATANGDAVSRAFGDTRFAALSHVHSGGDITSGTVAFARLPTGTGATEVSVGNHNHNALYSVLAHAHAAAYVDVTGDTMSGPLTITSSAVVAKFYRTTATASSGVTSWSSDVGGVDTQVAIVEADGDFLTISDRSVKENIRDAESMLDKILGLRIRRYDMKGGGADRLGVVAQEAEEVAPDMILDRDMKMVSTRTLLFMLTKAVQELAKA